MKKKITLLALVVFMFSCNKEDLRPEIENEEPLSAVNAYAGNNIWTDVTGRIEIWIGSSIYTTSGNYLSKSKTVPSGFVCIGGGGQISWTFGDVGSLLTESRPFLGGGAFNGWKASAKAHMTPNSQPWNLRVYAVGLRLKDNNGNYIPASTLKQHLKIYGSTSSSSSNPYKKTNVSSAYHLISGGAKVNWSGYGHLLTESYPSGNGWIARGKDHGQVSPASVTSYAIGIKKTIPNFGSLGVISAYGCDFPGGGTRTVSKYLTVPTYPTYLVAGIGGKANYSQYGRMLSSIEPKINAAIVVSKDHMVVDGSGTTCAYYIAIKKN